MPYKRCVVEGCGRYSHKLGDKVSLYGFPKVKEGEYKALFEKRHSVWLERTKFTKNSYWAQHQQQCVIDTSFLVIFDDIFNLIIFSDFLIMCDFNTVPMIQYRQTKLSVRKEKPWLLGTYSVSASVANRFQRRKIPSQPKGVYFVIIQVTLLN